MSAVVRPIGISSRVVHKDEIENAILSPARAEEMLSHFYDNQRPVIDRHSNALRDILEDGLWRSTSLLTCIRAAVSGAYIAVNGAHRLTMISRMTENVPISIRWITVADSDLLREAEAEYRILDANGKNRTTKDILWSYGNVRSLGLEAHLADKIANAAHYIELGFPTTSCGIDMKNRNADVRVPSLIKHVEAAKRYLEYIGSAKKTGSVYKELVKKPIMAAAIVICGNSSADEKDLEEFFYTISLDDGLRAHDPRKLLVDLMKNGWKRADGKPYRDVEKAILIKKAWLAWSKRENPQYFKVTAENMLGAADFIAK